MSPYHIFDLLQFKKLKPHILMQLTTQVAVIVSIIILGMKLFAYQQTCSHTLWNMILDSGFDISISMINFFIIRLVVNKITKNLRYSYDKIASLAALAQGFILIALVIASLLGIAHTHQTSGNSTAIIALVASTILCLITISLQKYTIALTHSVIIEIDMMHYKSDILANAVVIISMCVEKYYNLPWLDQFFGCIVGLYLIKNSIKLLWRNIGILVDKQDYTQYAMIADMLKQNNIEYGNLFITYSGMRYIISFDVIYPSDLTLNEIDISIINIKHQISHLWSVTEYSIKITPVIKSEQDIDTLNASKISYCHLHAH